MSLKFNKIESEAMSLSPQERAQLAEHLISSLDLELDPGIEDVWAEEAEVRYKAYLSGSVSSKTAKEVFEQARNQLK